MVPEGRVWQAKAVACAKVQGMLSWAGTSEELGEAEVE